MIISQSMGDISGMLSKANKLEVYKLEANVGKIKADLTLLEANIKSDMTVKEIETLDSVKRGLRSFLNSSLSDSEVEMCILNTGDTLKMYPVNFDSLRWHQIDTTEYFKSCGKKVVKIDYTNAVKLIAFEIINRELAFTHDTIEGLLSDMGVICNHDDSALIGIIDKEADGILDWAKELYIENSQYIDYENKIIYNYFNSAKFPISTVVNKKRVACKYKEVLESSFKTFISIMLLSIISSKKGTADIRPIAFDERSITVVTDEVPNIIDVVDRSTVRIFGRKFKIEPTLEEL